MSSGRRVRFDDTDSPDALGPRRSGRRFVVAAGFGLALVAAGLALAFAIWRSRHDALAAFGAGQVAPAVEPLARLVPPGVEPGDWQRVVHAGRGLIVALSASGGLDRAQMERLADEIRARVAGASPATAAEVLGSIWTDLEVRAGPLVTRARRFDLASTLHGLASRTPAGVEPAVWALAVVTTRAMLADAADPSRMSTADRRALHQRLNERLAESDDPVAGLAEVWAIVGPDRPVGYLRPAILAEPEAAR